ncbi:hypothetical protein [Pedobacter gandavensis]|uniref:hypothetical protein n=1 Tax=Pedobacter gandavensis TaxID=2679963 RepID=UPI00293088D7|nr:hypothetical protein [Pedobacter gandavensis]
MSVEYAIIVKNKTRLESLIERFNTKAQAKFYIESLGGDFKDYEIEHEAFYVSLNTLQTMITKVIKYKIVDRAFIPSFIFSEKNIIVVIGQDGLVANVAKYAKGVPIVAVNPDTDRYDGVLLPFTTANFMSGIEGVIANQFQFKTRRFAEARLNDGQRLLAFNDLFIGASSHVSARYRISYGAKTEEHSSSGLIVSTPAGSTGWLSSIINMSHGIASISNKNQKLKKPVFKENDLIFAVREPFKSIRTQTDIVFGSIKQESYLKIESLMPSNGIIFSDGIEADFLNFNSGAVVTIGIASEAAKLVGISNN